MQHLKVLFIMHDDLRVIVCECGTRKVHRLLTCSCSCSCWHSWLTVCSLLWRPAQRDSDQLPSDISTSLYWLLPLVVWVGNESIIKEVNLDLHVLFQQGMELTGQQLLNQWWKGLWKQKMNVWVFAKWMAKEFLMKREIWSPQLCLHRLQGLNCLQTGWHPSPGESVRALGNRPGNGKDEGGVG